MTGKLQIVVPGNGRPAVEDRFLHRPRPDVQPYEKPSDGSTLVLLDKPSRMTKAHVGQWAHFNKRR